MIQNRLISQKVSIPVKGKEDVSGVITIPEVFCTGKGMGIILAHGARNDMEHPLIVSLSQGLAEKGFLTLRFNFPYIEKGKKTPDSRDTLILTWQYVYRFLKEGTEYRTDTIFAAGKSMGGRVASQMVAEGLLATNGLIFLGYPLHPPGRKGKMTDAHLYHIKIPMLFFAGTHDSLCDLKTLKKVLDRLDSSWHLEIIEGGDHSFVLPKSAETTQQEVYGHILNKTVDWLTSKIN
ncbi:MAG: alpha/beta family hydrolase [Thermodesulfobacteriota bacterium]|nr:alpha/beta family hydrolase [Thermodesulfobacteriota bacterium]